jgi:glutamate-1-semialdehyde 2,1-aminomutase
MMNAARALDPQRIASLVDAELERYRRENPASESAWRAAGRHLIGGVGSSYQHVDPFPLVLESGVGSKVTDADGHVRIDYHNAFGSMVQGHAHPLVTEAIARRAAEGSHFSAPNRDAGIVADLLAERFGLPAWRFSSSGSEATMDAIRIARGFTGHNMVVKITGSYHGHHDAAMVDTAHLTPEQTAGDQAHRPGIAYGAGIPPQVVALTVSVPFNDADALEARLSALEAGGRPAACLIMEAAMMNCGVILPADGYLARVREITRRHNVIWIVDEVKTGLAIAAGGACEYFGIAPDMVCLAKALGAGLSTGAIGMTEPLAAEVASGRVRHVGTFSGNPLAMAAARVSMERVLTPDAYAHLGRLETILLEGVTGAMTRHGIPGDAVGIRSKGVALLGATNPITDFVSWSRNLDPALNRLAWLYGVNRGIYTAPGRDEEWTLSVAHSEEDVRHYVRVFDELCAALAG